MGELEKAFKSKEYFMGIKEISEKNYIEKVLKKIYKNYYVIFDYSFLGKSNSFGFIFDIQNEKTSTYFKVKVEKNILGSILIEEIE